MNAQALARFYEAVGYDVVWTENACWYSASSQVYQSIPPTDTIDPSSDELRALYRKRRLLGVQYPTARGFGAPSARYVVRDKGYGLDSLQRQFRQHVRRARESCSVRELAFDELHALGTHVNTDAVSRRMHRPRHFSDAELWRRYCEAGRDAAGAGVFGCFVGPELASYLVYFVVDRICHGLHMLSRSDLWGSRPNHLLYYEFTRTMIARDAIDAVTTGLRSLPPVEEADRFKRHAGYTEEPCRLALVFRPAAKLALLNPLTLLALGVGGRIFPDSPRLGRLRAVVATASSTQL